MPQSKPLSETPKGQSDGNLVTSVIVAINNRITWLSGDIDDLRYEANLSVRLLWVFSLLAYAEFSTHLPTKIVAWALAALWIALIISSFIGKRNKKKASRA